MDASDIIRLLQSRHYAPADLEEVNNICRTYPEFTAAQLLKVRIMEALGHNKQKQLKIAAVYSMDRKKLFSLVTEVTQPADADPEPEPETEDQSSGIIHFSDEPDPEADIIIDQHAPYAGRPAETDLLEMDEESTGELLEIVDEDSAEQAPEESMEETADQVPEESVEPVEEGPDAEADVDFELDDSEDSEDTGLFLGNLEKEETDMEEPGGSDEEFPSIDQMDRIKKENSNDELIRNFIKGDPGPIRADQETRLKGDVSQESIREHDGLITDTLARIYVKQGLFAKAIYAYERLSLKYPEKSAYFAAQIEKIKNINHS